MPETDASLVLKAAGNPAAFTDLLPVLKDVPQVPAEVTENLDAEVSTVFLFGRDLLAAIRS